MNGKFIKEYRSVREAAKELNTNHANISRCCNGEYKHTQGFIFRYEKVEVVEVKNPNGVKKIVIEIDESGNKINEWNSIMECAKSTGIDSGNISRVCNGKSPHIKRRRFIFKPS